MANVQYYGTGRRKHSVARVRLVAGEGNIIVNGRAVEEYFNYETLIRDVKQPLVLTNNENKYDVIVKVEGGGFTGQAGACLLYTSVTVDGKKSAHYEHTIAITNDEPIILSSL